MRTAFSSQQLRDFVRASKLSLRELSRETNYSTTTLSLWLRDQYPNDPAELERAIEEWAHARLLSELDLSPRDRRKFSYITHLLEHAEDKEALLATILRSAQTTENRPSSRMPALPLADGIDRH